MRGEAPRRLRATQAGISLVETLVALVLGLAMVSVAFNLYVSNRAVFRQIEAMVRLQESASVAAALLETNLRHAGGTLCRNNPPTTVLVTGESKTPYSNHNPQAPARYWEVPPPTNTDVHAGQMGLHAYPSARSDPIVGSARLVGDSISIMSDNMGAVARVTGRATHASSNNGLTGSYTFPVDNGLNFPVGTVAMACDYARAVLFQVTESTASTITLDTTSTAASPGNCAVSMKLQNTPPAVLGMTGTYNCSNGPAPLDHNDRASMYTFGPGSMIGEHSFSHWYIGRKTGTTDGFSLFRRRMVYQGGTIGLGDAEEMVQDVVDMQITVLRTTLYTGYPAVDTYQTVLSLNTAKNQTTYRLISAVRIVLTLKSPEKVGLAANNAASAATYTIPINVAIRARMPGVVRR